MPRSVFAVWLALAVVGCSADAPEASRVTAPRWELQGPVLSIGGMADDPAYQLFGVRSAARLSDGRIALVNAGTSEIRFYAADGSHLMDVGGEGDGPGEYRFISQMIRLDGDTLLVTSRTPGFSWITPDGELVRSQRFDAFGVRIPCRISEGNFVTLPDRSTLARYDDNFYGPDCPSSPPNPWRQSALIARVDPVAETWDTLVVVPGTGRNSPNYRVFGHEALVAVSRDGLYVHDTASEEILHLDLNGDTLGVLRRPFEPRPVPAAARSAPSRPDYESRDGSVQPGNPYMYPDELPAVARLMAGTDGSLWVMAYPEVSEPISTYRFFSAYARYGPPRGGHWRVLAPDGSTRAELRTPPGFFPMEIGRDHVLGLRRNEFDVESVELYEIVRPGS